MKTANASFTAAVDAIDFNLTCDDGPFVVVNLLKFKVDADYADGSDAHLSGREAYARYRSVVGVCRDAIGARMLYAGEVIGLALGEVDDLWDMISVVQYPSLAAVRQMASSDGYKAIEHHRNASLAGQLSIRTRPIA